MPPRQGQSQLISPVSSLKAPCWEASSSVSERGLPGEEAVRDEVGSRVVGAGGEREVEGSFVVAGLGEGLRAEGEREDSVGSGAGSE